MPRTLRLEASFSPSQKRGRTALAELIPPEVAAVRVPRIARLMALAIRFEGLIQAGEVRDYAELARLGHVSRARITQIMNLLLLAPDIQEEILFLPPVKRGRDPIHLAHLQPIAQIASWKKQRPLWAQLRRHPVPRAAPRIRSESRRNCLEVSWRPR